MHDVNIRLLAILFVITVHSYANLVLALTPVLTEQLTNVLADVPGEPFKIVTVQPEFHDALLDIFREHLDDGPAGRPG